MARFRIPAEGIPVFGVTVGGVLLSLGMLWHTWISHTETTLDKRKPRGFLTAYIEQQEALKQRRNQDHH